MSGPGPEPDPDPDPPRPLDGIRVVELAQWVAGPAATGLMADWGADVIKVEAPSGDPQRRFFAALGIDKDLPNPSFAQDNRGKRSVVLDLGSQDGRRSMETLLADADVFVTNLRPGALARLDLAPESLRERHRSLVVASLTGYGSIGPDRDTPGYDIGAFAARTGLARLSRPKDEAPGGLRPGQGDHTTGLATCAAVLAALVERARTGRGRLVETSLYQTGVYTLSMDLSTQATIGRLSSMKPRERHRAPMTNCYRAGDGRWFYLIGVEAARHFPLLCKAIDRPDLATDERFASGALLAANSQELIAILDEVFAARDLGHWAQRFEAHDVWYAPCRSAAEVVADPQSAAMELFQPTVDGDQTMTTVASPVRFDGRTPAPTGAVPGLGEHTDEVLAELARGPGDDGSRAGSGAGSEA